LTFIRPQAPQPHPGSRIGVNRWPKGPFRPRNRPRMPRLSLVGGFPRHVARRREPHGAIRRRAHARSFVRCGGLATRNPDVPYAGEKVTQLTTTSRRDRRSVLLEAVDARPPGTKVRAPSPTVSALPRSAKRRSRQRETREIRAPCSLWRRECIATQPTHRPTHGGGEMRNPAICGVFVGTATGIRSQDSAPA
jgi:hypothetical protein